MVVISWIKWRYSKCNKIEEVIITLTIVISVFISLLTCGFTIVGGGVYLYNLNFLRSDGPNGVYDKGFIRCLERSPHREDCNWCHDAFKVARNASCLELPRLSVSIYQAKKPPHQRFYDDDCKEKRR